MNKEFVGTKHFFFFLVFEKNHAGISAISRSAGHFFSLESALSYAG